MTALTTQTKKMELTLTGMTDAQVQLVKDTMCPNATPDEMALFFYQCNKRGLDPLKKEIYFIKFGGKMAIVEAVYSAFRTAHRTGEFAGNEPTRFEFDKDGNLISATAVMKRLMKGGAIATFTHTCDFVEYNKKVGQWGVMPKRMLEKCAEVGALRKAFPEELAGVYIEEEMQEEIYRANQEKIALPVGPKFQPTDEYNENNLDHKDEFKKIAAKHGISDNKSLRAVSAVCAGLQIQQLDSAIAEFLEDNKSKLPDPPPPPAPGPMKAEADALMEKINRLGAK